jgi:hypothetical protein
MLGHLISFRSDPERIHFWKQDELCELSLVGRGTDMKFSDSILCTGYRTRRSEAPAGPLSESPDKRAQDEQVPCPDKAKGKRQCWNCRNRDISRIYTRLDFTGFEDLKEEYVSQEFSLYLAAFGDSIVKCGVTRSERIEERTHEQGADFWCELMRFPNAGDAYHSEAAVQSRFGLKNFVRNDMKLKLLGKPKSAALLEAKLKEILACAELSETVCEPKVMANDYGEPSEFEVSYAVSGTVTGSKAQMLFFRRDGRDFVAPMYDAVGRVFLMKD